MRVDPIREDMQQELARLRQRVEELEEVVVVAEQLSQGRNVERPQPHHKLWAIVAGQRLALASFGADIQRLTTERDEARRDAVVLASLAADAYSGLCYIQSSMERDPSGYAKFYANGVGWCRVRDAHSNALPALTRHTPTEGT